MKKKAKRKPHTIESLGKSFETLGGTVEKLAVLVVEGFEETNQRTEELRLEMTRKFDRVDARFDAIDARFDGGDEEMHSIRTELADIRRSIERLEEQGARQAGYSKEIDHLIERVSKLEKHPNLA